MKWSIRVKGSIASILPSFMAMMIRKIISVRTVKRYSEDKEPDFIVVKHLVKKGNEPDEMRTARMILKMWQSGNIR